MTGSELGICARALAWNDDHVHQVAVTKLAQKGGSGAYPRLMKGAVVSRAVLGPQMETARVVELTFNCLNEIQK